MRRQIASDKIYVAVSHIQNAGRGVFARQAMRPEGIIEVCPIIEVPLSDASNDDAKGLLTNYFFYFGDGLAMVLGFGSLYNHSYTPNATYIKDLSTKTVIFKAITAIAKDEEITVNYNNGDPAGRVTPMNHGVPPVS